jgi:hypothetical protein
MLRKVWFSATVVVLGGLTQSVQASTAFLTFDDRPLGPPLFGDPAATIIYPQATFSGGTILGNPTNFPAETFATSPNVYGTTDGVTGYLETLTIAINPLFPTDEVSFPVFNGETFTQSYTVAAFNASMNLLVSQDFTLPPNLTDGFAIADLMSSGIAFVTIMPDGAPASFDFLIDSVALNQSVQQAAGSPGSVTPLPAALPLFATGLGVMGFLAKRRNRKTVAQAAT